MKIEYILTGLIVFRSGRQDKLEEDVIYAYSDKQAIFFFRKGIKDRHGKDVMFIRDIRIIKRTTEVSGQLVL